MSTVYDGALLFMLPEGEFRAFDQNETLHRSLVADPCKGRFSVKQSLVESNLGSHSFNIERESGELDEMVLFGARLLEDGSGAFFVAIADQQGDPVREVLVVSKHGMSGPAANGGGRVTRFYTDGGLYCVNLQDDIQPDGTRPIRAVKYLIVPTPEHPNIATDNESTWVSVGVSTL